MLFQLYWRDTFDGWVKPSGKYFDSKQIAQAEANKRNNANLDMGNDEAGHWFVREVTKVSA